MPVGQDWLHMANQRISHSSVATQMSPHGTSHNLQDTNPVTSPLLCRLRASLAISDIKVSQELGILDALLDRILKHCTGHAVEQFSILCNVLIRDLRDPLFEVLVRGP